MNSLLSNITQKIALRSQKSRELYLLKIEQQHKPGRYRGSLSCGNLAHGFAASDTVEKKQLAEKISPNIAIVSAYNDMLSAHQPYQDYPALIKKVALQQGASAQFAGGVPAMCDGVTQGRNGMELSLFSRDHIAMSAAIALAHDMFDGAVYLGICDKIVPGLLIGALSFGHLPGVFIPAGPMPSGLPNSQKAKVRQLHSQGKATDQELLAAESQSYHTAGTCTFYGTANSNQMLMEIMGLQLPGSSFEAPTSGLRAPFTAKAVSVLIEHINQQNTKTTVAEIVTVKSIVNGLVGLLATGGSTNHAIHLIAIARAAGIILNWQDMHDLSAITPLLCRVYPNGEADINQFHSAGGMRLVIHELLNHGLLHNDVTTILGNDGLSAYTRQVELVASSIIAQTADTSGSTDASKPIGDIRWNKTPNKSADLNIIRPASLPFSQQGGLNLLDGNIGRAVIKVSAVKAEHQTIVAPAKVFQSQESVIEAFNNDQLNQDFVAVLIFQGPKSNGMPELHKLTPILGTLQDQGFKVALVTDGRMSGASGKIPAAIHVSPEAIDGGPICLIQDGDIIQLDCAKGLLSVKLSAEILQTRIPHKKHITATTQGMGRELFEIFRRQVSSAELGASIFIQDNELATELPHA